MTAGRLRRSARLAPVAALTWGAAAAVTALPATAWLVLLCGIAVLGSAMLPVVRAMLPTRIGLVIAVCGLCAGLAALPVLTTQPAREEAAVLAERGTVAMQVHVVGKIEPSGRLFAFDAQSATIDSIPLAVPVVVRASAEDLPEGADIGAVLQVTGSGFTPGGGERAAVIMHARAISLERAPEGLLRLAAALRTGLAASTSGLPQPGAGLIAGLSVGDTVGVDPALEQQMIDASLSHLTAVSGANCALVVGCAFALAAAVGASRWVRALAGLLALAGFVVLVSPEPSVVRAAVMAGMAMIAVLGGRAARGVSVLIVSVTGILMTDPWLAWSIGFALSVAASGALLIVAPPLARGLERWMPRTVALAIAVPLAAQVACAPLIVLIDPQVSLGGVMANVLAAPAAPAATVLGLLACLVPFAPVLQAGLSALAWVPATWIAGVAAVISALPASTVPWLPGAAGALALTAVGAAIVVAVVARSARWRRARAGALVMLALVGGGVGGSVALSSVLAPMTVPVGWSYALCDIGQGDAILIRSADTVSLIDTGPDPDALRACLRRFGVSRLEVVVLTHFDVDHVGATDGIDVPVGTVLHGPVDDADDRARLRSLNAASVVAAHAGMAFDVGGARWRVLWPRADAHETGNDASVVVEVTGDGVPGGLFLGDLGAQAQQLLRAAGTWRPPYEVVKVAHHGSADQDEQLYELVDARVALISVGAENTYGHPAPGLLAMLQAQGVLVLRTDEDGAVVVAGEPTLTAWRERVGPASESPAD